MWSRFVCRSSSVVLPIPVQPAPESNRQTGGLVLVSSVIRGPALLLLVFFFVASSRLRSFSSSYNPMHRLALLPLVGPVFLVPPPFVIHWLHFQNHSTPSSSINTVLYFAAASGSSSLRIINFASRCFHGILLFSIYRSIRINLIAIFEKSHKIACTFLYRILYQRGFSQELIWISQNGGHETLASYRIDRTKTKISKGRFFASRQSVV